MQTDTLSGLTVKDLRALAAARGIAGAARLHKAELITALAHQAGPILPEAPNTTSSAGSASVHVASAAPTFVVSHDLPIPPDYGHDRLVLMVQDPHHLFAYWEITPETIDRVLRESGSGTPVLVIEGISGTEQREVDLRGGNYYLTVAPRGTYRAGLALRGSDGRLHLFASSNQVATPPADVSERTDEQWLGVEETFHELLARSGLPGSDGTTAPSSAALAGDQRVGAWAWKTVPIGNDSSSKVPGAKGRPLPPGQTLPLSVPLPLELPESGLPSSSTLSSGALAKRPGDERAKP